MSPPRDITPNRPHKGVDGAGRAPDETLKANGTTPMEALFDHGLGTGAAITLFVAC